MLEIVILFFILSPFFMNFARCEMFYVDENGKDMYQNETRVNGSIIVKTVNNTCSSSSLPCKTLSHLFFHVNSIKDHIFKEDIQINILSKEFSIENIDFEFEESSLNTEREMNSATSKRIQINGFPTSLSFEGSFSIVSKTFDILLQNVEISFSSSSSSPQLPYLRFVSSKVETESENRGILKNVFYKNDQKKSEVNGDFLFSVREVHDCSFQYIRFPKVKHFFSNELQLFSNSNFSQISVNEEPFVDLFSISSSLFYNVHSLSSSSFILFTGDQKTTKEELSFQHSSFVECSNFVFIPKESSSSSSLCKTFDFTSVYFSNVPLIINTTTMIIMIINDNDNDNTAATTTINFEFEECHFYSYSKSKIPMNIIAPSSSSSSSIVMNIDLSNSYFYNNEDNCLIVEGSSSSSSFYNLHFNIQNSFFQHNKKTVLKATDHIMFTLQDSYFKDNHCFLNNQEEEEEEEESICGIECSNTTQSNQHPSFLWTNTSSSETWIPFFENNINQQNQTSNFLCMSSKEISHLCEFSFSSKEFENFFYLNDPCIGGVIPTPPSPHDHNDDEKGFVISIFVTSSIFIIWNFCSLMLMLLCCFWGILYFSNTNFYEKYKKKLGESLDDEDSDEEYLGMNDDDEFTFAD